MSPKRKNRLIEIARGLSHLKTGKNLHFSFILNKNSLLVTAVNSYKKEHPRHRFGTYKATKGGFEYKPGIHSEISAISQFVAKFGHSDFSSMTLFNVRLDKAGNPSISVPCNNCQRVLNSFNFKKIMWTENDKNIITV